MSGIELMHSFMREQRTATEANAYAAGKDCAKHGTNTENCHFRWFGSPRLTKAWEAGKNGQPIPA